MKLPIAVQLYSVRDETEKNFAGTLKKVAGIGYKGVEFAGFGNLPAKEMKKILADLDLVPVGSHTGADLLTGRLDEVIEYNLELGNKYIVCPWYKLESKEDILKASELFNGIGEKIRAKGLEFLYHNHNHEFKKYDGEYGLDLLYKGIKNGNMEAEFDTGWIMYAGENPVEYIKKYSGRGPLIHIKDFASTKKPEYTEVGNGLLNVKAIAAASEKAGSKWLIVEQDECKGSSIESIRISFENLKRMGLA